MIKSRKKVAMRLNRRRLTRRRGALSRRRHQYTQSRRHKQHRQKGGVNTPSPDKKTLVMYCYYETPEAKVNLEYFLKKGVYSDPNIQYLIIVNNEVLTVSIPSYPNVEVLRRKENEYDLATYCSILKKRGEAYFEPFHTFYFINSTCLGPFLPVYCSEKWTGPMNKMLETYAAVGPVAELPKDTDTEKIPFLHTYMFGLNKEGFNILFPYFTSQIMTDKKDSLRLETGISHQLIKAGKKIKSLLLKFKDKDINAKESWKPDIWFEADKKSCYEKPGNYDGIDLNPLEVVFVKNIRKASDVRNVEDSGISDVLKKQLDKYTKW